MGTREAPFSALISEVIDNRGKTCPTADSGIPLIATNCIRNELLYPTYEKIRFVSPQTYSTWFRGHPRPGDILFVNKATPGRVCLVPDPVDFCIAQDMVAVRADTNKVYPRYLFAVLRSPIAQGRIARMHVGTLIPHFKKGDFDKLFLPLPGSDEQTFIGDIYFELSAKIDLNRRMNETLEAVARALFKSWFVDFDPVRAKAKGRDPGLPKSLADLFPARLVDSELGEIPDGWEVKSLDEIARFLNGLALQKYPPSGEWSLPVIKIAQLRAGSTEGADRASAGLEPAYIVQNGDVLFSWSGSLECVLWAAGPGALNQHLFKVTSEQYPKWLYYLGVHHHLEAFRHIAAGKATTMGHIQRHHLSNAKLAVPSPALLAAMDDILAPIVESTWRRAVESRTLAAVRDTLLPKLISGELQVNNAETFMERVAS
jgi:type I restriction enzyme S subunit